MLANQLAEIAEDMISEYKRFSIVENLEAAVKLATDRPSMQTYTFHNRASELKRWATDLLDRSIMNAYPIDVRSRLMHSKLSQGLPISIARMVISGFQEDSPSASMSSGELNMHLVEAKAFFRKMANLADTADSLGVKPYEIPEGLVALEVLFPDRLYGRTLDGLPAKLENASAFIAVIGELCAGSRPDIRIVWLSTSDLLVQIAVHAGTAWAAIEAYGKLLEVAEKQLNVIKLIKELRRSGGEAAAGVEPVLRDSIQTATNNVVIVIVEEIGTEIAESRKHELETEIKKIAPKIVDDISNGLRIRLSARSQRQFLDEPLYEESSDTVKQRLESRSAIELRLDSIIEREDGAPLGMISKIEQ